MANLKTLASKCVLASLTLSISSAAFAAEPTAAQAALPQSIGALGDSITAGLFANFSRSTFFLPWNTLIALFKVMAAAGGGGLSAQKFEVRSMSWSTGGSENEGIWSHERRIASLSGVKAIQTYNAAVSGDESENLADEQIGRLHQWTENTFRQAYPDYVTVLAGPNDVCAESAADMVPTDRYYNNMARLVDEMLQSSPKTKILVSSIPNIEKLRNVAKDKYMYIGVKCEALWKTVKLCPTITTISDPEQRRMIGERVVAYNQALQDIVQSRVETYGDRIRLATDVYETAFSADMLSIDCFHPGPKGQRLLSQLTFNGSWWKTQWQKKALEIANERIKRRRLMCAGYGGPHSPPAPPSCSGEDLGIPILQ